MTLVAMVVDRAAFDADRPYSRSKRGTRVSPVYNAQSCARPPEPVSGAISQVTSCVPGADGVNSATTSADRSINVAPSTPLQERVLGGNEARSALRQHPRRRVLEGHQQQTLVAISNGQPADARQFIQVPVNEATALRGGRPGWKTSTRASFRSRRTRTSTRWHHQPAAADGQHVQRHRRDDASPTRRTTVRTWIPSRVRAATGVPPRARRSPPPPTRKRAATCSTRWDARPPRPQHHYRRRRNGHQRWRAHRGCQSRQQADPPLATSSSQRGDGWIVRTRQSAPKVRTAPAQRGQPADARRRVAHPQRGDPPPRRRGHQGDQQYGDLSNTQKNQLITPSTRSEVVMAPPSGRLHVQVTR